MRDKKIVNVVMLLVLVSVLCSPLTIVAQTPSPSAFILGPQSPLGTSWFDTTQVTRGRFHADGFPASPPAPEQINEYVLTHYYDLGLSAYALAARTGDQADLARARKVEDSWWRHPDWIREGRQRDFENGKTPPPRHGGIGGLILRALDGRPEMWDWINSYTRFHFDLWLKRRIGDSQLYYGVREGAFALHYATWLAKVLPDAFPLQGGGTELNGAGLRAQYLADVEAIVTKYFGRLQQPDGSWRWDDVDFTDSDGGTLKGITQPFMVGLLLNALVDVHRLSTNETVRSSVTTQIVKACKHLFQDGPYRKDEPVTGLTGKRWRSFWYFYHGGTSVNPTKYARGGGSYVDIAEGSWVVNSERQSICPILTAYAYGYFITGDSSLKTMFDELFDSAFGGSGDGIRSLADGTAKNYNQAFRLGARHQEWIKGPTAGPATRTPSLDGTKAESIVDSQGGLWTIGAQRQTLRDGVHMGGGAGSIYKFVGGSVYVLGTDSKWYRWTGSGWSQVGAEPGVTTPTPTPTPSPLPIAARVVVKTLSSSTPAKQQQEINEIETKEGLRLISCSALVCYFASRP